MARKPLSPPALELHDGAPISANTPTTTNRFSFGVSAKEESSTDESFDDFAPLDRKPSFVSERSSSTTTSSTTTTATKTTTSGTTSQGTSHSLESNDRIRSRYLFKLGVIGAQQGGPAIVSCSSSASSSTSSRATTWQENTTSKGHTDSECPIQVHQLVETTVVKKMVRFMTKVQIHAIPHHSNYSLHTKQLLWTSPEEMEEMTYRNYFEFASEQWDWHQAVEEEDFCLFAGKRTHPAHVTRFSPSRQFCLIHSARLQQQQQQLQQQQQHRCNGKRQPYHLRAWH